MENTTQTMDNYTIFVDENITNSTVDAETTSHEIIIACTLIFILVGTVGIGGNMLVMLSVMCNRKMRSSMTNLLIMNLAFADLLIMVFGIPEIVVFMRNTGWSLGLVTCKINRYVLVAALYGSILTLVALSVERYIAIIHPIKAHIFCNKRRLVAVLGSIWPVATAAALPTALFNTINNSGPSNPILFCMLRFPVHHDTVFLVFKYTESIVFYFTPMCLQIILYACISKYLFIGTDRLYHRVQVRDLNGLSVERLSEALRARRGVVKMLVLSVFVYFLSYSPHQVLLVWNTVSPKTFHENWSYLVFTMIIAYINSAVNPILYSIFSQNFRNCYKQFVLCLLGNRKPVRKLRNQPPSQMTHGSPRLWRIMSTTASTNV
ncbi:neuropeptide receptor 15-like [Dreissena polymorpha]|uniref:neuropeptide receptor 15-like n=1 Tax=Dreissena polymorpha TaxID=45954 RepID=UPI002264C762|nr:neuropeptide receptor 15-like [Dreissena polymorpha]